jgi:hypothetical protein
MTTHPADIPAQCPFSAHYKGAKPQQQETPPPHDDADANRDLPHQHTVPQQKERDTSLETTPKAAKKVDRPSKQTELGSQLMLKAILGEVIVLLTNNSGTHMLINAYS